MERISHDRTRIVMPVIDSIDADSLAYRRGGIDILGFTWTLGQAFLSRPKSDVDPMLSPVMAGGLFSIDRLAFYELGTYDQEMRFYGGEEMEFSFRAWQCGYSIECLPCSRVRNEPPCVAPSYFRQWAVHRAVVESLNGLLVSLRRWVTFSGQGNSVQDKSLEYPATKSLETSYEPPEPGWGTSA